MKTLFASRKFFLILAISIICCFVLSGNVFAANFADVSVDTEYSTAINILADNGYLTGDSNGNFNPSSTITRAEMATIVCRVLGVENEAKSLKNENFTDVTVSHWAVGYIAKAVELKVINGYGDGKFGPDDAVTAEQAIAMLIRAYNLNETADEEGGFPHGYITVAQNWGFTNGISINKFSDNASRALVAQLVYNALYY